MNAVLEADGLDAWGRDWKPAPLPMTAAPIAAPAPEPVAIDPAIYAELAELRAKLTALEERVLALSFTSMPPVVGSEWTQALTAAVADHWEVSVVELVGRQRTEAITRPRFALCWLLRKCGGFSYPRIAQLVGYVDHTSVGYGVKRIEKMRETDEALRYATDRLLVIGRQARARSSTHLGELAS